MLYIPAKKTLAAIEHALRSDQGQKFRSLLRANINACDDAFDDKPQSPYRSHLGASMIGRDCPRALWYSFRWVKFSQHAGKTILLFNRGHMEEGRFVTLLQMIGCQVWQVDKNGHQYRINGHNKHYGSAIDGVVKGCPDMPDEAIIAEFKTSNTKNFKKVKENGVRQEKFEHFVQMQQYMGYYKLRAALYIMICKETDELHAEIVHYDEATHLQYFERAGNIIASDSPPAQIANTPGAWACKFCDYKDICHNGAEVKEENCRTCRYSEAWQDGLWRCRLHELPLTKEMQAKGCGSWEVIPGMNG